MSKFVWRVPEPLSSIDVVLDDHATTRLRQHGNPQGHRLLLSHGNGLAIDFYYPFWSLLERDFELFVYDLRNHGWNELGQEEDHHMFSLVSDVDIILDTIDDQYGVKPVVGVYHSISALIALLFSSSLLSVSKERLSRGFDGLILFDPPIHRPGTSREEFDAAVEKTARQIRNKSSRFDSLEQYLELLDFFPTFSRFVPGAKELMAATLLKESEGQDGYVLRCPPPYEARIGEYMRAYAEQTDLNELPCPTRIVGADPLLPFSYLPTVDLSDMLCVDFDFIPEATHYMQVEKPRVCADYVYDFLKIQY